MCVSILWVIYIYMYDSQTAMCQSLWYIKKYVAIIQRNVYVRMYVNQAGVENIYVTTHSMCRLS